MLAHKRTGAAATLFTSLVLALAMFPGSAAAQYSVTNLVSNLSGHGKFVDTDLVNAWGMSFSPVGPFWVSDNGTGLSTVYTGAGVKQSTIVTIPTASGMGVGSPTGQVYNSGLGFQVSQNGHSGAALFIFATEDGTLSGWSPAVNATAAVIAVTQPGADYTGLAIGTHSGSSFLFAADNLNNRVDIYDSSFKFVTSFTDTALPAGSNPYGVQTINGQLYVTFTTRTGGGVVDIFDTAGNFVKHFALNGPLKAPWGVALAPATGFGKFSGAVLVGNVNDGRITAFNATTGKIMGQLVSTQMKTISIQG
ncbi:MAG TPA: TIGR03118 family protein, partial [Terriglobia bacterium]|nr:TIGR03118 family protein [Terriglobia bacterium]